LETFLNNLTASRRWNLFVVPDISFRLLYCAADHGWPAQILWFGGHIHPTADGGKSAHVSMRLGRLPLSDPRSGRESLVARRRRLRSMGIRDRHRRPPRFPRAKTDLLSDSSFIRGRPDHVVVCGERHLRHICVRTGNIPTRSYASILGERSPVLALPIRADGAHSLPPSSRRATPPIYPDLILRQAQPRRPPKGRCQRRQPQKTRSGAAKN